MVGRETFIRTKGILVMKLHHIAFAVALICAGFAWGAPMAWDRHAACVILAAIFVLIGLTLATGSALLDVIHPTRNDRRNARLHTRDLDRAFNAGRDLGSAEGPTEATLRRWSREGFNVPGTRR